MNHIPQCPVCGNSALPEFFEPRGYALCPQCGFILRRLRDRLLPLYNIEPAEQIDLETSLPKGLGLDSLDMVELVMALKEEFGVEITDEEAAKIKTVEDIVRFLARHDIVGTGRSPDEDFYRSRPPDHPMTFLNLVCRRSRMPALQLCLVTLSVALFVSVAEFQVRTRSGLLTFEGGRNESDPCEVFAHHGFNGIECEVVAGISEWIVKP